MYVLNPELFDAIFPQRKCMRWTKHWTDVLPDLNYFVSIPFQNMTQSEREYVIEVNI